MRGACVGDPSPVLKRFDARISFLFHVKFIFSKSFAESNIKCCPAKSIYKMLLLATTSYDGIN